MNSINFDFDFYKQFIKFIAKEKDISILRIGLNYINDLEIFVTVFDDNKEYLYKNKKDYIIKADKNLKLQKIKDLKEEGNIINVNEKGIFINKKDILIIIEKIECILIFSYDIKIFFLYLTNEFWKYLLYLFNEPSKDYIFICFRLRKNYLLYIIIYR